MLAGCVEHRLIVRSDPPDVAVYVDGRLEGRTDPQTAALEIPFTWFGTRKVVARKAGYVPLRQTVELDPPWWQLFPVDVFSDLLWPGTLEDVHRPEPLVLQRREAIKPAEEVEAAARQFKTREERHPR